MTDDVDRLARQLRATSEMELAGPAVYFRGVGYHRDGRVGTVSGGDRFVRASVRGTVPYEVELRMGERDLQWSARARPPTRFLLQALRGRGLHARRVPLEAPWEKLSLSSHGTDQVHGEFCAVHPNELTVMGGARRSRRR